MELNEKIEQLAAGYSEVIYRGKKYSLSKLDFNEGKSILKNWVRNISLVLITSIYEIKRKSSSALPSGA